MRLSRGCYDKFHRCPGWIGGGSKYARVKRCYGGRLVDPYEGRLWRFRFQHCDTCDVLVLPYATRWVSVPWLLREAQWKTRNLAYRWRHR